METLTEIGKRWNTDKATWHNYTKIYEKYFNNSRKQCIKLFEIGIFLGRSLKMWHDYFENGLIFAMDNCALSDEALIKSIEMDRIRVCFGDQGVKKDLDNMIRLFGSEFDIIVDDGAHVDKHQQISLGHLFPHLKSGGIYAIEDLALQKENEEINTATLLGAIKYTNKFPSTYITTKEQEYLCDNIEFVEIYKVGKMQKGEVISDQSIIAMIKKK